MEAQLAQIFERVLLDHQRAFRRRQPVIEPRQEEAQRLGRILRPKADGRGAKFYSVVSRDTIDQDFAQNRQRFLAEQGYAYEILDAVDL